MGFCNPAQFPKFFCPSSISSNSLENVLICLPTSLLAVSLMKITFLLQNVSFPAGSILEACWRKVSFSENFYLSNLVWENCCLVQLCYLDLVFSKNWFYAPPSLPLLLFYGGGPWRKGCDFPLLINLNNSSDEFVFFSIMWC